MILLLLALSDLKTVGNERSWNNKSLDGGRIVGRLDRALCNAKWLDVLPFSSYEYLPQSSSDHSPLQIHMDMKSTMGLSPFKIFNFWQNSEGFQQVLQEAWSTQVSGSSLLSVGFKVKGFTILSWEMEAGQFDSHGDVVKQSVCSDTNCYDFRGGCPRSTGAAHRIKTTRSTKVTRRKEEEDIPKQESQHKI